MRYEAEKRERAKTARQIQKETEQRMQQKAERRGPTFEIPERLDHIYDPDSQKAIARRDLIRDAQKVRKQRWNETLSVKVSAPFTSGWGWEIIKQCEDAIAEEKFRERERQERERQQHYRQEKTERRLQHLDSEVYYYDR